jgi:hypothetical protein
VYSINIWNSRTVPLTFRPRPGQTLLARKHEGDTI